MASPSPTRPVQIPVSFYPLYTPARYKTFFGGRGAAKSWNIARALVSKAYTGRPRILCARQYQNSIADSVHRLLTDQIDLMGLTASFHITKTNIYSATGAEFLFKGLERNIQEIKSTEGIDVCWIEEAQSTTKESLEILDPTIRKEGSELWFTFNTGEVSDPVYQQMVVNPAPGSIVRKVGWQDNPYFPETLDKVRRRLLEVDPEAYAHVWDGEPRLLSDAVIFRGRYVVDNFEAPLGTRFFFGADWGFANDPTVLIRCFILDEELYIDYEAVGYGVELEDIEPLFAGGGSQDGTTQFAGIPAARDWPIKADSSRPETISYVRRKGFNIDAAEKWTGCVEDGIAHLKGFRRVHIHERCKNLAMEARLYQYKVDRITGDILPVIVDKHNHGWDAIRYSLDGYITSRGGLAIWEKLGRDS